MLEKLMDKLGYIPKSKFEKVKTVLKDITDEYEKNSRTLNERTKKVYSLDKQLKSSNKLIENQVIEINSLKTTINNLQQKNRRLEKCLKETKRKEAILLKKQGKFKEQISEKEVEINYLNQKVKLLEIYNYAVITKLEEICFGSVLPRVMKQVDLSKYMYPLNPIKLILTEKNGDIRVEAVGVKEINEKKIT